MQDPIGLDPSVKSNMESCWLFGGFPPQKVNALWQQLNTDMDRVEFQERYKTLRGNQAIMFEFTTNGNKIRFIAE